MSAGREEGDPGLDKRPLCSLLCETQETVAQHSGAFCRRLLCNSLTSKTPVPTVNPVWRSIARVMTTIAVGITLVLAD